MGADHMLPQLTPSPSAGAVADKQLALLNAMLNQQLPRKEITSAPRSRRKLSTQKRPKGVEGKRGGSRGGGRGGRRRATPKSARQPHALASARAGRLEARARDGRRCASIELQSRRSQTTLETRPLPAQLLGLTQRR